MPINIKKKGANKVGYKKPPKSSQFKPGKSGNPKGRPKETRNFKTDLLEELQETIAIKESGQTKTVSKQRAMLKILTAKAVQGDIKATTIIVNLVHKLLHDETSDEDTTDLSAADQAILEHYKSKVIYQAKKEGEIK
ncbi:MAG: hypothetical protein HN578_09940 [Rhodospirillales bacterium]|jgi:hypothetical protein|nr:hypothetical protein [Betaproteobacteria bacterium]MBT7770275.1 hypothetical protein [Rhodospirillales bacterium]MBT8003226.1 hypothetical protein [Rhodospirillales bacterium]